MPIITTHKYFVARCASNVRDTERGESALTPLAIAVMFHTIMTKSPRLYKGLWEALCGGEGEAHPPLETTGSRPVSGTRGWRITPTLTAQAAKIGLGLSEGHSSRHPVCILAGLSRINT